MKKITNQFTTWIRNLSRLLSAQVTNYDNHTWICDNCLNHFYLLTSFENHKSNCLTINEVKMILPNKNNKMLNFKNYRYKEAVLFAMYADFECLLEPTVDESRVQNHIPHCAAYYLKCVFHNTLSKFAIKRGPECIEWFIDQLLEIA